MSDVITPPTGPWLPEQLYCESDEHALYVGAVAGIAMRNGVHAWFVDDEVGRHTNRLLITVAPNVEITVIVPPPPPGWKLDDWLPPPDERT